MTNEYTYVFGEKDRETLVDLMVKSSSCEKQTLGTFLLYAATAQIGLEQGWIEAENDRDTGFYENFVCEGMKKFSEGLL